MNPVTQEYLTDAIDRAENEGYDAVVILLDTPGGLESSMREIVKKELEADLPVIVYVAPEGARAASAGLFLTMAADVAAMAPQTNIGSSTPISGSGEDIPSDLKRKVVNDAVASIRALAVEHEIREERLAQRCRLEDGGRRDWLGRAGLAQAVSAHGGDAPILEDG